MAMELRMKRNPCPVRVVLGMEMGREVGGGSGETGKVGPLTGGEKHDACREGPGEAGEGRLLRECQDAHDDARGGAQGGQDHEGPGGIPISCGSTDRSLSCHPWPQWRATLPLRAGMPASLHVPDPAPPSPVCKHTLSSPGKLVFTFHSPAPKSPLGSTLSPLRYPPDPLL